jgi:hypothetical protein
MKRWLLGIVFLIIRIPGSRPVGAIDHKNF